MKELRVYEVTLPERVLLIKADTKEEAVKKALKVYSELPQGIRTNPTIVFNPEV